MSPVDPTLKRVVDIVAPALKLLHPIFGNCLEQNSAFGSLEAPFLSADLVCATNRAILVWQVASPEIVEILNGVEPRRTPKVKKFIAGLPFYRPRPSTLPKLPVPGECPRCDGVGKAIAKSGRVVWRCSKCDGEGFCLYYKALTIGRKTKISVDYVRLLTVHKAKVYLPEAPDEKQPIKFTVGDVTGVVMPMGEGPPDGEPTP